MNPSNWPEPDLNTPEVSPLTSSLQTVLEAITGARTWDNDGMDAVWWTSQLIERGIMEELTVIDIAAMFAAVLRSNDAIAQHLKKQIYSEIGDILAE